MWKLLALGYGLLYEHVDMIGGVTQTERATKTANFLETRSCSLSRMLISVNQNAERARSAREKERGRILIAPFLLKKMWCLHSNRCVAHVIAEAKVGVAVGFIGRFGRRGKRKLLEKLKEAC